MAALIRMSLDAPEETRPFEGGTGQLQVVNLAGGIVGRANSQPGWKWSEHVKPIAKTDSCQAAHTSYFVSGRMMVAANISPLPSKDSLKLSDHQSMPYRRRAALPLP